MWKPAREKRCIYIVLSQMESPKHTRGDRPEFRTQALPNLKVQKGAGQYHRRV
jgi:hypothetical protein